MSNIKVYQKPFDESWAYANVLKGELGAASYDIQPFPGTFKRGRDRWMPVFLNSNRKVIARRIGMELTSGRTGGPYKVFSRQEWIDRDTAPQRTVLSRQQTGSDAEALDVLNSIYAEA